MILTDNFIVLFPPDFSIMGDEEVGCTGFGTLPFGACEDPVR